MAQDDGEIVRIDDGLEIIVLEVITRRRPQRRRTGAGLVGRSLINGRSMGTSVLVNIVHEFHEYLNNCGFTSSKW